MDVRASIVAKAQIQSVDFQNMRRSSRMLETDVGETEIKQNKLKDGSEMKLCENSIYPRFVIRPVDTYILANQTGTIEARIGRTEPKPVVKWYKNGQLITGLRNPRIKKHHNEPDTYVLEIQEATESDMGSYSCVARNCYGRITSSATVHIVQLETEEYPRFLKRLQCIDVFAGKNGRLEVRVTGVPKPEVKWFKNSMPLKENERIEIRHYEPYSYVLSINHAEPEDSGLYTCKASNNAGTRSTSAMVYVEENENVYIDRPLARLPYEFLRDNECSEDLTRIRRQLERRQCPDDWSERERDDFLYRVAVANYHIKYRTPWANYSDLF